MMNFIYFSNFINYPIFTINIRYNCSLIEKHIIFISILLTNQILCSFWIIFEDYSLLSINTNLYIIHIFIFISISILIVVLITYSIILSILTQMNPLPSSFNLY